MWVFTLWAVFVFGTEVQSREVHAQHLFSATIEFKVSAVLTFYVPALSLNSTHAAVLQMNCAVIFTTSSFVLYNRKLCLLSFQSAGPLVISRERSGSKWILQAAKPNPGFYIPPPPHPLPPPPHLFLLCSSVSSLVVSPCLSSPLLFLVSKGGFASRSQ